MYVKFLVLGLGEELCVSARACARVCVTQILIFPHLS